jgi:MarR family transcriptional regulator, transcriptional regulator for hemolysin
VATELAPTAAPALPGDANLCWLLSRAAHVLKTRLTAGLEELGVSPRGHHVLAEAMHGEYTQTELARLIGLDKTTMVVTVDELEAAGLAERRPAPHDRRARVIGVTEAGAQLVRRGQEIANRIHAQVLATLPEDQRQVLIDSLVHLVTHPLAEPAECAHTVRRE